MRTLIWNDMWGNEKSLCPPFELKLVSYCEIKNHFYPNFESKLCYIRGLKFQSGLKK